jgi:hypothetical protein
MGTKQNLQKELDSYHTSDSCVTRGRVRLHGSQSRFFFDFGRISGIKSLEPHLVRTKEHDS